MYDIRSYQFPSFFEQTQNFLQSTNKLSEEEKKLILEQIDLRYREKVIPVYTRQAHQEGLEAGYKQGFEKGMDLGYQKKITDCEESLRSQTYQKEFDRGFCEGKSEGERLLTERVQYLDTLITQIQSDMMGMTEVIAKRMLEIIHHLVKKIIFANIGQKEQLEAVLLQCIQAMPGFKDTEPMEVWIHPSDKASFTQILHHSKSRHKLKCLILIEKDDIEPGGCLLSWKASMIDGQLSHRFQKIIDAYCCPLSFE